MPGTWASPLPCFPETLAQLCPKVPTVISLDQVVNQQALPTKEGIYARCPLAIPYASLTHSLVPLPGGPMSYLPSNHLIICSARTIRVSPYVLLLPGLPSWVAGGLHSVLLLRDWHACPMYHNA